MSQGVQDNPRIDKAHENLHECNSAKDLVTLMSNKNYLSATCALNYLSQLLALRVTSRHLGVAEYIWLRHLSSDKMKQSYIYICVRVYTYSFKLG